MSSIEDFLKDLRDKEEAHAAELFASNSAPQPEQPAAAEPSSEAVSPETASAATVTLEATHACSNGHPCRCDGPGAHSCGRTPELEEHD